VSLLKELAGVRFAILVLWGPVTEAGPPPGFQDLQHYMHCSGPACLSFASGLDPYHKTWNDRRSETIRWDPSSGEKVNAGDT
jgi:hypothetical protein